MKRVTIFAHYDKQNIIDPYVIDYLKELKKYSEIIFVSDGNLKDKELQKIQDLCFDNICQKHGEFDFGSYKRGFLLLKEKYTEKFNNLDEILFVNDSCYLTNSFEKTFQIANNKNDIDCWGLTDDYVDIDKYYITGFFISFRKSVFLDSKFQNFIDNIGYKGKDDIIIKYEFGLSEFLLKNNKKLFAIYGSSQIIHFLADNFFETSLEIENILTKYSFFNNRQKTKIIRKLFGIIEANNSTNYIHSDKYYFLIKADIPIIKRRILELGFLPKSILLFFWKEILQKKDLNIVKDIENHCNRVGISLKNSNIFLSKIKYFLYIIKLTKLFYKKNCLKNGKKYIIFKFLFIKIKINSNT